LNNFLNIQKTGVVIAKRSLSGLLDEALKVLDDRIALKNIRVHKNYSIPDIELKVNGSEILIALTNIILNAVDAMRPNDGQLTLHTCSLEGEYSIQIEDNGCGMGSDELEKIFDTYYTSKSGGIGLGLSTTKNILYSNNIDIKVESEIGKGTIFTLTFRHHQE
jgi:signal transduction histidine kinase